MCNAMESTMDRLAHSKNGHNRKQNSNHISATSGMWAAERVDISEFTFRSLSPMKAEKHEDAYRTFFQPHLTLSTILSFLSYPSNINLANSQNERIPNSVSSRLVGNRSRLAPQDSSVGGFGCSYLQARYELLEGDRRG